MNVIEQRCAIGEHMVIGVCMRVSHHQFLLETVMLAIPRAMFGTLFSFAAVYLLARFSDRMFSIALWNSELVGREFRFSAIPRRGCSAHRTCQGAVR